jgi:hypothetical protein
VACASCGFQNQDKFQAEIAIHSRDIQDPPVLVFPRILVCMNCGKPEFTEEFAISDDQLRLLSKRGVARKL